MRVVHVRGADDRYFQGLSPGAHPAGAFAIGTTAQEADDRIIYDPATGHLFHDRDGTGAAPAIHFATLSGVPALAPSDFVVI